MQLQNTIRLPYFAWFINILTVITKGRGIRPGEALATLYLKEGATFYSDFLGQITKRFLPFHDTFLFFEHNSWFSSSRFVPFPKRRDVAIRHCERSEAIFWCFRNLDNRVSILSGLNNKVPFSKQHFATVFQTWTLNQTRAQRANWQSKTWTKKCPK